MSPPDFPVAPLAVSVGFHLIQFQHRLWIHQHLVVLPERRYAVVKTLIQTVRVSRATWKDTAHIVLFHHPKSPNQRRRQFCVGLQLLASCRWQIIERAE